MFITFEGIDGSGKSVQVKKIVQYLKDKRIDVLHCFDPGFTQVGNAVRDILLDIRHQNMAARTELLLYAAARSQLVKEVIFPHLQTGGTVISDRFYDSTTAYQGFGRQLDLEIVKTINQLGSHGLQPDYTFIIDTDIQTAAGRIGKEDRLESESFEFRERVREGYLAIAENDPERCHIIDGNRDVQSIHISICDILTKESK